MADTESPEGLSLRKRLAHGDELPSGDFGVQKLDSTSVNGGHGGDTGKHLADHERGAGRPVGHNQANPNHGEFK